MMINHEMYFISFSKYYLPLMLIDLKEYNIECKMNNICMFFFENPRTNIELMSAYFEFFFQEPPDHEISGQILCKTMISYRTDLISEDTVSVDHLLGSFEFLPCVLFTKGMYLKELLLYLPEQKLKYMRELKYYFTKRTEGMCQICCEEDSLLVNIHGNISNLKHEMCEDCLWKLSSSQCPFCRQLLLFP